MKTTGLQIALAALLGLAGPSVNAQTIGAPLIHRSITDLVGGEIYALNSGFTQSGTLSRWAFFNDNPDQIGKVVTPLLLQRVGTNYFIVGVGTSRTNDGSGVQAFNFGLQSGSAKVVPGCLFGWKDGVDADSFQTGVIQFDFVNDPVAGTQQWFYTGEFSKGHSGNLISAYSTYLGAGLLLGADSNQPDRDYSVQATVMPIRHQTASSKSQFK